MKRLVLVAGILVGAGVIVFLFAPVLSWASPVMVDAYQRAQVSPSWYFFRCGVVYNLAIIYTENGQVFPASSWFHNVFGAFWSCEHVAGNQSNSNFGWWA